MVLFDDKHKQLVADYLNAPAPNSVNYDALRREAKKNIALGGIMDAISNLEEARDARKGISTVIKDDLLIRDARTCIKQHVGEGCEAAEIRVLASFEAAKDVLTSEKNLKYSTAIVKATLNKMAESFFDRFSKDHDKKTPEQLFELSKTEVLRIGDFLNSCGIKNADKKIDDALHFQNFKQDTNYNLVTISQVSGLMLVESSMSYKGYTQQQEALYDEIAASNNISKNQKNLMNKYRNQVFSGNYMIPAGLIHSLPGIKNAFEESTFLVPQEQNLAASDFKILDSRKRAAALPTLLKDKDLTTRTTQANLHQAQELMTNNKSKLNWNSLNTDIGFFSSLGFLKRPKIESDIVRNSREAANNNNASFSATPFNAFRRFGDHDLQSIDDYLQNLGKSIPSDSTWQKKIKSSIKRSTFKKKATNILGNLPDFDEAIAGLDDETAEIFSLARSIRKDLKKHGSFLGKGRDKENLNLHISTKFGHLTFLVNEALDKENSGLAKCCHPEKIERQEQVISCKSGKDRTGFNCFYRMAKKVAQTLGFHFGNICHELHYAGHIETIPGSLRIGGGTAGCYQLQKPVLAALPQSEAHYFKNIIGPFSHHNKKPTRSLTHQYEKNFVLHKNITEDAITDSRPEYRAPAQEEIEPQISNGIIPLSSQQLIEEKQRSL